MASSKDVFEPSSYAARNFACGTFRGLGIGAAIVDGPYRCVVLNTHQPGYSRLNTHQPGDSGIVGHQPGSSAQRLL